MSREMFHADWTPFTPSEVFWNEWGAWIIAGGIVGAIVLAICVGIYFAHKSDEKNFEKIKQMGFELDEVRVFLNSTDWDYDDFLVSKGVRKAFMRFYEHGDMSGIVKHDDHTTTIPVVIPMNMGGGH